MQLMLPGEYSDTKWLAEPSRREAGPTSAGSPVLHYNDVIMGAIASQITSLMIVFSTVYLDTDQRKHQSSASLAFVRGIHRRPVNSPHKWPVTRKMFPFDDVIMRFPSPQVVSVTNLTWTTRGAFYWHILILIPKRIIDYTHYVCEIIYSFPNFNGAAAEDWELISNFTSYFTRHMLTYLCLVYGTE